MMFLKIIKYKKQN